MTYINQAKCRRFMLELAKNNRAHKFSRVSQQTLNYLNLRLKMLMMDIVSRLPSKGKTI